MTWQPCEHGDDPASISSVFYPEMVLLRVRIPEWPPWVGHSVADGVGGLGWPLALLVLCLVYFFSHYFFASNTAHIVAMYAVFLGAAIAAEAPPLLAALVLGFLGNLFGGLTHYASGPAGVVFGSGYVHAPEWFRVGFVVGVSMLVAFTGSAVLWDKVIGIW